MFRVGFGYDIHKLVKGRKLFVGGVNIPSDFGLLGHSDADVLVHALCDALLGGGGFYDIGTYFPDSDPEYKNICSLVLLKRVWDMVGASNRVVNIDSTIVAELPKLAPFIEEMRVNIANVLDIDMSLVGIKAKTKEGIGAVGRGEAMEAYVVVLLDRKG